MDNLKITVGYERGNCSICKEMTQVRLIMDNKKVTKVCNNCVKKMENKSALEIHKEYGKKRSKTNI